MGFDAVATGHHARITYSAGGITELRRGEDPAKDQSYVLAVLDQPALAMTLLPVGEMTKADVRAHAQRLGLRTATKAESMDVCFITRGGRKDFLDARIAPTAGEIVDTAGSVVGVHDGVRGFTIGQRRGLAVATGERRYVVEVDAATATVTLGERRDLLRDAIELRRLTFTDGLVEHGTSVLAQVRSHGEAHPAVWHGDVLRWERPQPRVAPGQTVAMFDGDRVLGSGIVA